MTDDPTKGVNVSSPCCGRALDAATSVEHEHRPAEGDVSVCAYCAALLVFDTEQRSRLMLKLEFVDLDAETRRMLHRVQDTILQLREAMTP